MNLRRLKRQVAFTSELAALAETIAYERMQEVRAARDDVCLALGAHGLHMASACMRITPVYIAYEEFRAMADDMRAGGYHRVRDRGEEADER